MAPWEAPLLALGTVVGEVKISNKSLDAAVFDAGSAADGGERARAGLKPLGAGRGAILLSVWAGPEAVAATGTGTSPSSITN